MQTHHNNKISYTIFINIFHFEIQIYLCRRNVLDRMVHALVDYIQLDSHRYPFWQLNKREQSDSRGKSNLPNGKKNLMAVSGICCEVGFRVVGVGPVNLNVSPKIIATSLDGVPVDFIVRNFKITCKNYYIHVFMVMVHAYAL